MDLTSIVVDNFLTNPGLVRSSALSSDFITTGNYPGFRSSVSDIEYSNHIKEKIEKIIGHTIEWDSADTTKFQLCFEDRKSVV